MCVGVERIDGHDPLRRPDDPGRVGDIVVAQQLRQLPRDLDVVEVGGHDRLQRDDRASRVLALEGDLGNLHVGAVGPVAIGTSAAARSNARTASSSSPASRSFLPSTSWTG